MGYLLTDDDIAYFRNRIKRLKREHTKASDHWEEVLTPASFDKIVQIAREMRRLQSLIGEGG
jgi:hypothetical protein